MEILHTHHIFTWKKFKRTSLKMQEDLKIQEVKNFGLEMLEGGGSENDATPERLAHARANDAMLENINIKDPSGFETKVSYRKIDSPIESALRKKWIHPREYMAGIKFTESLYASYVQSPMTGKLEFSVDGSRVTTNVSDRKLAAQESIKRAMQSIDDHYREPFFSWVSRSLHQDVSLYHFGLNFSKARRKDRVVNTAKRHLSKVLDSLAVHYGF